MKTVKLKANSVSEFVYDIGNSRLIVYKNDSSIPRSIKRYYVAVAQRPKFKQNRRGNNLSL